ncbi:replication initiator protein A [Aerococcaceae bacterium NML160702]|nr:replication initiator protein A [Aerococcaceae bacterium NML160702]
MLSERISRNQIIAFEQFYQLPKVLFFSKKYVKLSLEAKVMYAFFYSRTKLSETRNYVDKENNIYFFYGIDSLMDLLGCGRKKVIAAKKELVEAGLLDEEKTGRTNKMYLKNLDVSDITSEDLETFDIPEEDETLISENERKQRSENAKKQWQKRQKKRKYILSNRMHDESKMPTVHKMFHRNLCATPNMHEVSKAPIVQKMFHRKMHEVSKMPTVHKTASNQHSLENEKCTECQICTSDVSKRHTRYIELDRVDNNLDYILDQQTETEQKNSSKDLMFKEQYLADMSREYSPEIMMAVKLASEYEDLTMLNRVLKNAMDDIFKGKPYAYKEASEHTQSISGIIGQLGYYHSPEISIAVKNAIVRATRFAHRGNKSIENSASYYYAAIQKAIINYVVDNYELPSNNSPLIHEANEGYMRG